MVPPVGEHMCDGRSSELAGCNGGGRHATLAAGIGGASSQLTVLFKSIDPVRGAAWQPGWYMSSSVAQLLHTHAGRGTG